MVAGILLGWGGGTCLFAVISCESAEDKGDWSEVGGWRRGGGCSYAVEDVGGIKNVPGVDAAFYGVLLHSDWGKRAYTGLDWIGRRYYLMIKLLSINFFTPELIVHLVSNT